MNTDKNVNTVKTVNKRSRVFSPPTFEEFTKYFSENGFSSELATRAFQGYNVASWTDSTGKQIKNWKQKCYHVWFRPENKLQQNPQLKSELLPKQILKAI
jgi:hypothetical protein